MHGTFVENALSQWLLRQTSDHGLRRVALFGGALASEIGNVRQDNQDKAVWVRASDSNGRQFTAVVVADGMGGMREGEKCASTAIGAFVSSLISTADRFSNTINWVTSALNNANDAVFEGYQGKGGTTVVALVVREQSRPVWASAGDSRVYSFTSQKLRQLSIDDTIAGQLGKVGRVPALMM
ncbi:hypothetical protein SAMN04488523_1182 [Sulfitobacter brevis]|uniref:PPM-type phosphatase domain-containing protein n=1 Tax=Sulfitobacter brevis TaxID=74348 RepID=A0A1I2FWQ4_9RHOB|nr:protein phosphatase 2C domain-containing protein [Sulfitobacter brevis]SFF09373.1 hypothetical protein SAMN04488523_1182 [Sulfitobacter brevis]